MGMLLLKLDDSGKRTKSRQIVEGVRKKIERGELRPSERLPSTRRLAESLGFHRSTVAIAYQELWALGFLDLRPGARPVVRERIPLVELSEKSATSLIRWTAHASPRSRRIRRDYLEYKALSPARSPGERRIIDFGSLDMDRRLFPVAAFRSCLNRVLRERGDALLRYGDPQGYFPLRETIADRLRSHGLSATAAEILVTDGSQHAIDLVLRMIAAPGRSIAVESPTYNVALPLIRFHGLRVIGIPVREDGMDLSSLETALGREKPALVYTIPNFQNPTGTLMAQAHRERLLALCEKHRVPILEDGFEEEMKYSGRVVLPVKSMDAGGVVIYCGTFSKVLFPGVRIGWIAARPECLEHLTAIRRFSGLASNGVLQAAMDEFCREGSYDRHIGRMHRVFRKRMRLALRELRERIPPEWAEWTEPDGGYLIWLRAKPGRGHRPDWATLFPANGLRVSPGETYFANGTPSAFFRLSISTLDEAEIAEGIRRLSGALKTMSARRAS
jgi:DNA-binding transcriptional MocR family regulator